MLTTIGDKIIEIRPKQIIEANIKIDNHYLTPLNKRSDPQYKYPKKQVTKKNEELPKRSSSNTQAST